MTGMFVCKIPYLLMYTLSLSEWNWHSQCKSWVHLTLGFLSQVLDFKINSVIEMGNNIMVHTITFQCGLPVEFCNAIISHKECKGLISKFCDV